VWLASLGRRRSLGGVRLHIGANTRLGSRVTPPVTNMDGNEKESKLPLSPRSSAPSDAGALSTGLGIAQTARG
jgi:hypothetical protein